MQSQITFDNLKILTIPVSWTELKCEKRSEGFLITRKRASPSSYTDIRFSNSFFLFRSFTLVMRDGNCSISSLIPIFKTFNSSCSTRSQHRNRLDVSRKKEPKSSPLGHSATRPLGHSATRPLGYLATRLLGYSPPALSKTSF